MFHEEFGELVICCDGKDPWRKNIFPSYKANRKKGREADDKDWDMIFELMAMVRTEYQITCLTKFYILMELRLMI